VDVPSRPQGRQHLKWAGREPRQVEQTETAPGGGRCRAPGAAGHTRPRPARPGSQSRSAGAAAATARLPRPHRRHAPVLPAAHAPSISGGGARSGRTGRQLARLANRRPCLSGPSRCAASVCSHGSSMHSSTIASSGHTRIARAATDPRPGRSRRRRDRRADELMRRRKVDVSRRTPSAALRSFPAPRTCAASATAPCRAWAPRRPPSRRGPQRVGEEGAKRVGKRVGPFGTVDVKHCGEAHDATETGC
jgi:hypothetical protein